MSASATPATAAAAATLLAQPPYPWVAGPWAGFVQRVEAGRLPHALLIVGQEGIGCVDLAIAMAQYLLCLAPQQGHSCGQCKSCRLLQAGGHPDLHRIQPEEGSQSIKIGQIRTLLDATVNTAQQGGRKLVVLSPAEAMNHNAANALLKSLEEPSGNCVFILVTANPHYLMATIRSRCSRIAVAAPDTAAALAWLTRNRVDGAAALLAASGGRPLRVMEWLAADVWGQRRQLCQTLVGLLEGRLSFLEASQQSVSLGALWVVEQLQGWLNTAACRKSGASADPVDDQEAALLTHLQARELRGLLALYERVSRRKAHLLSSANPNAQMLMDELMMEIQAVA